jgi:multidrug efflux system outer membrane protein
MNVLRAVLCTAVATSLAACNLAPTYERPVAAISSQWPTGAAYPQAASADGALTHWDQFYVDPNLRRLIRLGLERNQNLRQIALTAQSYQALHRVHHAATLPQVQLAATGNRQWLPGDVAVSGETGVQSQYEIQTSASYEFDFFGKIRNLDQASLETYLASDEARQSAEIALIASIADAYLTWQTDQALNALVTSTLDNYEHSLRLVESNQQAGLISSLAVRQVRSLVIQAQTKKDVYLRVIAQDVNALELLLGGALPSDLEAPTSDAPAIAMNVPVGAPSAMLLQRPDIRAAEHALVAANANIGAARAAFFPSVNLAIGAGTTAGPLDHLFNGGTGTWSFLPSITLPIFNAGRLKASRDYAEIQKDVYIARYQGTIQVAFKEVADGLAARQTYALQLASEDTGVRNAQEYVAFSQQRFKQGLDGYLVVLDAQRTLLSAQQHVLNSRLQQLRAEVALFCALGGGWDAKGAADAASGIAATLGEHAAPASKATTTGVRQSSVQ